MKEPKWDGSRFIASFRVRETSVERFPSDCSDNAKAFHRIARDIIGLRYEAFVASSKNNHQISVTFDQCVVDAMCSRKLKCISEPKLEWSKEVTQAVGRNADMLIHLPKGGRIIVEV